MSRQTVILLTLLVYLLFIAGCALWSRKSSRDIREMTVGKRNAGAWVSALSYGTAYFSAVMFIGYAGGTGWKYGLYAVLPGIGNALIGSLLAWLVLAKRTRAYTRAQDVQTMPQLFERRYESRSMGIFAALVILFFLLPYSASVYKGLGSVCSVLLDLSEQTCMLLIAGAAVLLVLLGGYSATLKADFIQGLIMLFGVIALIVSVIRCEQVGGLQKGLAEISRLTSDLHLGAKEHIALWATVLMTSFGTWGLPQIIHKYYAIRDEKEIRRGTVISTVFALIVAGGGYFIGSLSRLFFQKLPAGGTDYLIPNMLKEADLSAVLLGLVLVLLIAASVSTLCSITITASSTSVLDLFCRKEQEGSRKKARLMQLVAFFFILASYFVANAKTPILDLMSYSWGVISGSFLAPYLLLLYDRKQTRQSAWAGMLTGFFTALPPVFCKLFFPGAALPFFGKLMDLGPHFACLSMALSLAVCFFFPRIFGGRKKMAE